MLEGSSERAILLTALIVNISFQARLVSMRLAHICYPAILRWAIALAVTRGLKLLRGSVRHPMTETDLPAADAPSIAVVCFLPDTGHVQPLLRLAHLTAYHIGARGTCYLAPRFEQTATEHGFGFRPLVSLDPPVDDSVFAELSRKSNFYNQFSDFADLFDRYWVPLFERVSCELEPLAIRLRADRPAVLVADDHIFSPQYRMLAAICGARLVLHRSSGSLFPYRRSFVRAYGLSSWPAWAQRTVEFAGELHVKLMRRWRSLRRPDRVRAAEAARAALEGAAQRVFGNPAALGPDPLCATSGTCVLEDRVAAPHAAEGLAHEVLLPPSIEPSTMPLPPEIDAWLTEQSRPIVYVSFGSMVWPEATILRNLARGLRYSNLAVLWAQPHAQRAWLAEESLPPERFYFVDFAPQTALLASGRIACFVTHAGSSSVQESLSAGVPMLCVPFLWDQPYNASVMVRLGVAVRLPRRRLKQGDVRAAVTELLCNPGYAERARALAAELRTLRDKTAQSPGWIERILQPSPH